MKHKGIFQRIIFIIIFVFILCGCQDSLQDNTVIKQNITKESRQEMSNTNEITIRLNQKTFHITLQQNNTVEALLQYLPMTVTMNDLNNNEKYFYMSKTLPTQSEFVYHIEAGDFMLYEDRCLVLFYDSFKTNYAYTRLGHIDNVDDFIETLHDGSMEVTFCK